MSAIFPKAALTPVVDPKDMSSDPLAVANYKDDPLNTGGNLMARVAVEADNRGVNLQKATTAAGIACPLYMAHGTRDACTSLKKAKIFFEGTSLFTLPQVQQLDQSLRVLLPTKPFDCVRCGAIQGVFVPLDLSLVELLDTGEPAAALLALDRAVAEGNLTQHGVGLSLHGRLEVHPGGLRHISWSDAQDPVLLR